MKRLTGEIMGAWVISENWEIAPLRAKQLVFKVCHAWLFSQLKPTGLWHQIVHSCHEYKPTFLSPYRKMTLLLWLVLLYAASRPSPAQDTRIPHMACLTQCHSVPICRLSGGMRTKPLQPDAPHLQTIIHLTHLHHINNDHAWCGAQTWTITLWPHLPVTTPPQHWPWLCAVHYKYVIF